MRGTLILNRHSRLKKHEHEDILTPKGNTTMKFTKLIFDETNWPDVIGQKITINFDKSEIEMFHSLETHSCRITEEECSSFKERLDACHLEDWSEEYQPPAGIAVLDGSSWYLKLYNGKRTVKDIYGTNGFPPKKQWKAFTSILNDAGAIAIERGKNTPVENDRRKLF